VNNKYQRLLKQSRDEGSFWPTFTDLITTILLLVLLFLITMVIFEQEKIAEQKEQIAEQNEQIEFLTGIRKDIIQDLDEEFKKRDLDVSVDPKTGTIKFSNDLLFETGKSNIRPQFKDYLQELIPVYFSILYGEYENAISEVVIEGHTR
jgi:chemotaxis protein MotB